MKWVVTSTSIVDKTKSMTTKHGNKYHAKWQQSFTILNNKGTTLFGLVIFLPFIENSPGVGFFVV